MPIILDQDLYDKVKLYADTIYKSPVPTKADLL